MKLSYKIFLYFGTFIVFIVLIFFTLNYYGIQRSLHQRARKDLHQMVESVNKAVENMLGASIRNYLRGVVEQDIAVLNHLNDRVLHGEMTMQEAKDVFQKHVNRQKIGESGYIVALDQKGSAIILDIHPFLRGKDCASTKGCQDWIAQKNGYSEYVWQNPEDKKVRKKVSYIMHFEPWDWVVGATSYEDEFIQLVRIEDLERFLRSFDVFDQGYFFVLDDALTFLIHPEMKGMSAEDSKDTDGKVIAREMLNNLGSFYDYHWKNPSEKEIKEKFSYAKKLENFNWFLAATGYTEDVTRPIDRLMRLSYSLIVLVAVFLTGLIVIFSRSLSHPLDELIEGVQAFYRDKKIFKMNSRSVAEIEAVGHSIEEMTKILADAEQEKKELLDLLDSIISSMPSILICIDHKERIILWNDKATEYSGLLRDNALNRPLENVFPEFKNSLDHMQQNIRSLPFYSDTCQIHKESGVVHHFALTLYPLHTELKSAVVRIDDISEQVHMKDVLLQSHKMESIGTLAGGIAHDFNNILSAIIGYTELSQMNISRKDLLSDYLDKIFKAGNRAKGLVQQILTFSRQTKQELRPVPVNIVVKEALKLLKASLPSTIEIHEDVEDDSLVMGDPTQLHQILMNLCTNASHAMEKEGGILKVELKNSPLGSDLISRYPKLKSNPHIHLMVSDTGCGIPPDVMERIFDPFFTTKEQGQGTGMGLSVVHGIVNSLKGIIDVKSNPGKGSQFNIFLPVVESELIRERRYEDHAPKGSERILFVDDEPTLVEIGQKLLEGLGYRVATRTSALEALELFKSNPMGFDLVITDMTMPQMTGDKLAGELISIREDIPVLLCTGFSSDMTEEKAREIGAKGFLMKPVVRLKIAGMIREILDE